MINTPHNSGGGGLNIHIYQRKVVAVDLTTTGSFGGSWNRQNGQPANDHSQQDGGNNSLLCTNHDNYEWYMAG